MAGGLAACAEFLGERGLVTEIIVADDGSTDHTGEAFADAVAALPHAGLTYRYLPLPHRGKGSAVRAGVGSATRDSIVFLDAELTMPVDIIDDFLRAIDEGAD